MVGLILGVNTLYKVFCFFKLFNIGGKGLKLEMWLTELVHSHVPYVNVWHIIQFHKVLRNFGVCIGKGLSSNFSVFVTWWYSELFSKSTLCQRVAKTEPNLYICWHFLSLYIAIDIVHCHTLFSCGIDLFSYTYNNSSPELCSKKTQQCSCVTSLYVHSVESNLKHCNPVLSCTI